MHGGAPACAVSGVDRAGTLGRASTTLLLRGALLLLCVCLWSRVARPHHAVAQTITAVELGSVALDEADVPGFVAAPDGDAMVPANFDAAFVRVLYAGDYSGALLFDSLGVAGDQLPVATLRQFVAAGGVLRMLTSNSDKVANFRFTGQLGVGDADLSAVWDGFDEQSGHWLTFYGDSFIRGRIVVTLVYVAPPAVADPSVIVRAAARQDGRLLSSPNLPDSVLGR